MKNEDRQRWFKVKAVFLKNCQETRCHYCGTNINDKNQSVDHKHPIAKGGSVFNLNNLVLCCKKCNRLKSDYDYDYFVANREAILSEVRRKKKELLERQAIDAKFTAINRNKDLEACFEAGQDNSDAVETEMKKFRSDKVSLVRITPKALEFNFSEVFPDENVNKLKTSVKELLKEYGRPVKALKAYVNFSVTEILFEVNHNFKVLVNFETKEETLLSKKQAALFLK